MRVQQNQEPKIYKAALYLRLSRDDGDGESSSIRSQREILTEYALKNGFVIADEYVDDGYSGTNMDRPGYQRMIADIERGKINCVLTKDLSRLARNGARSADLIDEYFPSHDVRYIAVVDNYDSLYPSGASAFSASLLGVMNEMYARDISQKIRSSIQTKMKKGECVSAFAPYGYQKDIANGNKNHLIPDPQTAPIVQDIFRMAENGDSPNVIAKSLNSRNVATPALYRCQSRPYLNPDTLSTRKEWSSSMICKMLSNEVYLGHTMQGKTSKVSFKSKVSKRIPKSEWTTVRDTHQPLVSEETFRIVRSRCISRKHPPTKGFENIFSGIAVCADCGRNMTTAPTKKKGSTSNLCCSGYKSYGAKECGNHFMDYDVLYDVVLQELRGWLSLAVENRTELLEKLTAAALQHTEQTVLELQKRKEQAEVRLQEIGLIMRKLYEDYALGRMSQEEYQQRSTDYAMERECLQKSIQEITGQTYTRVAHDTAYKQFMTLLDDITDIQELTRPLLHKLIDRIEVEQGHYTNGKKHKEQHIRIYYRFIGCVEEEKST